jgi:glutathione S-transferase
MLEEVGLNYELVRIDIWDEAAPGRTELQKVSPLGKVPALEDGEARVADSAAITLYLADRYAAGRLAPNVDSPERGKFLYWMFYGPAVMEPAMAERSSGWTPNRTRNGWADFDTMIRAIERELDDGPWIMGEAFTAADIVVGSTVAFMRMFGMLPDSPPLQAYADLCQARPAYQKAMALNT